MSERQLTKFFSDVGNSVWGAKRHIATAANIAPNLSLINMSTLLWALRNQNDSIAIQAVMIVDYIACKGDVALLRAGFKQDFLIAAVVAVCQRPSLVAKLAAAELILNICLFVGLDLYANKYRPIIIDLSRAESHGPSVQYLRDAADWLIEAATVRHRN